MFLKGKIKTLLENGSCGEGRATHSPGLWWEGCSGALNWVTMARWPFCSPAGTVAAFAESGNVILTVPGDTPQGLSHLTPEGGRPRKSTRKACAGLPRKRQAWWLPWREEAERKPCPWTPSGNRGEPQSRPHCPDSVVCWRLCDLSSGPPSLDPRFLMCCVLSLSCRLKYSTGKKNSGEQSCLGAPGPWGN